MRPVSQLVALGLFATLASTANAQSPSAVDYRLRVDSAGATGVSVEMHIQRAPASFELAMSTHPEYDDHYWRYIGGLRGESSRGAVTIVRTDSAVWRVTAPAGDVTIRYRVDYPVVPPQGQATWKAHLTATGGLVGGPHSFLYVPGGENERKTPVRLTLSLPSGWKVATGLENVAANTYAALGAEALIDSPIMVGMFRDFRFDVDGVPHFIAYREAPGGTEFDIARFTGDLERYVRTTVQMFGSMPYVKYQFLFEDGAFGGLEHLNSVSIGVGSANLARDPNYSLGQIAHEFFHTWNEVRIRPATWIGLRHTAPAPTGELWFSEGVTFFYYDLLLRRSALFTQDSTRVAHLERLLTAYLANPSHAMVSPERTSRAFNLQSVLGDFIPSIYTQGEVLGNVLDLLIREGSDGRRSLDDAMRALSARFSPSRGIRSADIESAVSDACTCDVHPFFESYVRNVGAIDYDRWLAVIGMHATVTWAPARTPEGNLLADSRVSGYLLPGESTPRLQIWFPSTAWARAGLHTGDNLISWNGAAFTDSQLLRGAVSQLHVGDTVRVAVMRGTGRFEATVVVPGYDRPVVRIEPRTDATQAQIARFERWKSSR
jgi:predicted metalloprotease with PDZ domain